MNRLYRVLPMLLVLQPFLYCADRNTAETTKNTLFTAISPDSSGIRFKNTVAEDESVNPIVYQYAYNGGGVAVGDVNNDGLEDVFFTSNQQGSTLYLNQGQLRFNDISQEAGIRGHKGWQTGAAMADVNGDGLLDIYLCYSGNVSGKLRQNQLFINKGVNNGIPRFADEAAEFHVNDSAFSTSAAFFDYDHDDDLDMVLVNHSPLNFRNLDDTRIQKLLRTTDSLTGFKLYRNEQGIRFTEVTKVSGIRNTRLSYGLGVSVSDLNGDGWPDIYLSNDFIAPDYIYINNRDGTFTDRLAGMVSQTSEFSMGNDVADINNDGLMDIITTDMMPPDNYRQKMLFSDDNYELFDMRKRNGLHAQYMRNMLHLNNGDGTFSEIARLAGVSQTDWSWSPLFADFDGDGWKDLFVTNGFVHDYTNMDFEKYMMDKIRAKAGRVNKQDLLELVKQMPSSELTDVAYRNDSGFTFSKANAEWGIDKPSNSNGAAYADLDNDGDPELIINTINDYARLYRNNSVETGEHQFLSIQLKNAGSNKLGVGAKVYAYSGELRQLQEIQPYRGFQSSVTQRALFGLEKNRRFDSVKVVWPGDSVQVVTNVTTGKPMQINKQQLSQHSLGKPVPLPKLFGQAQGVISYRHAENVVNDFKRQPLMTTALSYRGPCMAKADVNGDGRDDLFFGGASGSAGEIFIQKDGLKFSRTNQQALVHDSLGEDVDAVFLDADNDGDKDLYVCSGGYDDFMPGDVALRDRLYFNDGSGTMSARNSGPPLPASSSACVAAGDLNGDGKIDLFVGGAFVPGRYPETTTSRILINSGKGVFTEAPPSFSNINNIGSVNDAVIADMNGDGKQDLVTAGEWQPIRVWINNGKRLVDSTTRYFEEPFNGWWKSLQVQDINNDGKPDIVAGNMGLNSPWRADKNKPVTLCYDDFDDNGSIDPIVCYFNGDTAYPFVSRDELLTQIPELRSKFTSYNSFANASIENLFSPERLKRARVLKAWYMASAIFLSRTGGTYDAASLPLQAQFVPVYASAVLDVDGDGNKDVLFAGGETVSKIKMGMSNSVCGVVMKSNGRGKFTALPAAEAGLAFCSDIRAMQIIGDNLLLVGSNNGPAKNFIIKR